MHSCMSHIFKRQSSFMSPPSAETFTVQIDSLVPITIADIRRRCNKMNVFALWRTSSFRDRLPEDRIGSLIVLHHWRPYPYVLPPCFARLRQTLSTFFVAYSSSTSMSGVVSEHISSDAKSKGMLARDLPELHYSAGDMQLIQNAGNHICKWSKGNYKPFSVEL